MTYNWTHWDNPYNSRLDMGALFAQHRTAWSRFIPPGAHCIDVGAYTGDTAVPMAQLAGPSGQVVVFECNPHVLPTLIQNARQPAEAAPIIVVAAAAALSVGRQTFHYNGDDYCNGGKLLPDREHKIRHRTPLIVPTIDWRPFITAEVKFIKLDTEGNDLSLLLGAVDALERWHPTLQCEIYPDSTADERMAHANFLRQCGYTLYHTNGEPITMQQILDAFVIDFIATYV